MILRNIQCAACLLAILLFAASCTKCVDCKDCTGQFALEYEGARICEEDFGNKSLYQAVVSYVEDEHVGAGCICN